MTDYDVKRLQISDTTRYNCLDSNDTVEKILQLSVAVWEGGISARSACDQSGYHAITIKTINPARASKTDKFHVLEFFSIMESHKAAFVAEMVTPGTGLSHVQTTVQFADPRKPSQ